MLVAPVLPLQRPRKNERDIVYIPECVCALLIYDGIVSVVVVVVIIIIIVIIIIVIIMAVTPGITGRSVTWSWLAVVRIGTAVVP